MSPFRLVPLAFVLLASLSGCDSAGIETTDGITASALPIGEEGREVLMTLNGPRRHRVGADCVYQINQIPNNTTQGATFGFDSSRFELIALDRGYNAPPEWTDYRGVLLRAKPLPSPYPGYTYTTFVTKVTAYAPWNSFDEAINTTVFSGSGANCQY